MLITAASLYSILTRKFTSTPMVSFIDRLLVLDARMYVFNLSWPIKLADSMTDCSANSYQTYIFQFLIPYSHMGDLSEI